MRAFLLSSAITFSLVISVLFLNGCSPSMLMAGGPPHATKEEKVAWKAERERNAVLLRRMIERYDSQALAGDPSAQLNMARVWHQQYELHINDNAFKEPPFRPNYDEEVQANARPVLDKSNEYLNKAIAAGYPPALTYSVCRGGALESNRGQPKTAADLAVLKQAAALGEPHAQYLLAEYDYWNASPKDQTMLNPTTTQLLLDASEGGDFEATDLLFFRLARKGARDVPGVNLPEDRQQEIIKRYEKGSAVENLQTDANNVCKDDFLTPF
ncbi:hypothetical protein HT746_05970 [Burkholderia pyrrocinia]|uniref:hypothetical protein n=1 Tax=Burkholderia pyrrocinia TaxID=60550 RepID=UPI001575F1FB|nr:hypothetical protein [Burkholderia pyrrocinia]NTX26687.1 hypothetical protein [Burkholderia pyrrocinia]